VLWIRDPDEGFRWSKIVKILQLKKIKFQLKVAIYSSQASMKNVQATGDAFSSQKIKTSSTLQLQLTQLNPIQPGSWIRNTVLFGLFSFYWIGSIDPTESNPTRIQIHNIVFWAISSIGSDLLTQLIPPIRILIHSALTGLYGDINEGSVLNKPVPGEVL
jgi:hypothetical protein